MSLPSDQLQKGIDQLTQLLDRGRLTAVDLTCQTVFASDSRPPEILLLAARVALAVGELSIARRYLDEIHSQAQNLPGLHPAEAELQQLEARPKPPFPAATTQHFHLIKPWGFGFGSDLDHTVGHLLLAEMTGRTPVIHWGPNSLFCDPGTENAWPDFFAPVSGKTIHDLQQPTYTYFPPIWTAANLHTVPPRMVLDPASRPAAIQYLNQTAAVTVADFFTCVIDLLPWLPQTHPLWSPVPAKPPEIERAYQYMVQRYLKPHPEILNAVRTIADNHLRGHQVLAVHIRGTDKPTESDTVDQDHRTILDRVTTYLNQNPALKILLLTDDSDILASYAKAFPSRIIATSSQRSTNGIGVHCIPTNSRRQLGRDVMLDMYLAAECDFFLGMASSNVSNWILHLKNWYPGTAAAVGSMLHYERNAQMHI